MGSPFALFYNQRSISTTSVNTALTQAQLGGQYEFNNLTTQQTCTLPPGPNLPIGGCVDLTRTIAGQTLVVSTTDSSQIDAGGVSLVNSITVAGGEEAELWWNGTNWVATGTFLFGSIFGPNSYVQLIPRTTFYVSPTGSDSNPGNIRASVFDGARGS